MMKKLVAGLCLALTLAASWAERSVIFRAAALAGALEILAENPALASNCNSYTYTLTNGQTADANQVMANFNTIMTCANSNLAHNGANSDITSLAGLTTPLSVGQGGTGNATLTTNDILLGNGTGAMTMTSTPISTTIGGTGRTGVPYLQTMSSGSENVQTNATNYLGVAAFTSESNSYIPVALTSTIKNLYVQAGAAPGSGQSWTLTLRVGGTSTSVTCTMSGGGASACNDTTHSASVVPGNVVDLQVVASASAASVPMAATMEFDISP